MFPRGRCFLAIATYLNFCTITFGMKSNASYEMRELLKV